MTDTTDRGPLSLMLSVLLSVLVQFALFGAVNPHFRRPWERARRRGGSNMRSSIAKPRATTVTFCVLDARHGHAFLAFAQPPTGFLLQRGDHPRLAPGRPRRRNDRARARQRRSHRRADRNSRHGFSVAQAGVAARDGR